jgi:hypothetical protein
VSGRTVVALLAGLAALAGCGLKGPLYLPEKSQEIVIRPGPGGASGAPAEPTPEPAPEAASPAEGPPEAPQEAAPPPAVPDAPQTRPPGSGRG